MTCFKFGHEARSGRVVGGGRAAILPALPPDPPPLSRSRLPFPPIPPHAPCAALGWRARAGSTRARRGWLTWLLVATLFSALQGLLGAAAVTAVSGSTTVVEVCTPQGMRWLPVETALADAEGRLPGEPPAVALGLAQPCAWALAHVSLPPAPPRTPLGLLPRPAADAGRVTVAAGPPPGIDRAALVLLNAAMRAPPAAMA